MVTIAIRKVKIYHRFTKCEICASPFPMPEYISWSAQQRLCVKCMVHTVRLCQRGKLNVKCGISGCCWDRPHTFREAGPTGAPGGKRLGAVRSGEAASAESGGYSRSGRKPLRRKQAPKEKRRNTLKWDIFPCRLSEIIYNNKLIIVIRGIASDDTMRKWYEWKREKIIDLSTGDRII